MQKRGDERTRKEGKKREKKKFKKNVMTTTNINVYRNHEYRRTAAASSVIARNRYSHTAGTRRRRRRRFSSVQSDRWRARITQEKNIRAWKVHNTCNNPPREPIRYYISRNFGPALKIFRFFPDDLHPYVPIVLRCGSDRLIRPWTR